MTRNPGDKESIFGQESTRYTDYFCRQLRKGNEPPLVYTMYPGGGGRAAHFGADQFNGTVSSSGPGSATRYVLN